MNGSVDIVHGFVNTLTVQGLYFNHNQNTFYNEVI